MEELVEEVDVVGVSLRGAAVGGMIAVFGAFFPTSKK